jgi:segregation and condensation protein B
MEDIKNIIESLLFVSDSPLSIEHLKNILAGVEGKEIRGALEALSTEYEARNGGICLSEVAGGYQIRTRSAYNQWIKLLLKPTPLRLSQPALETLAIIAYRQPIIRADVEHLRGVDCGGVLRMLMEKKLVRVLGRKEIPGRPLIYATTKHFLEMFDLKDLTQLPTAHEIEAAGKLHLSREAAPPESTPTDEEPETTKNS